MNIGELINKFDNETDGTVKSFNDVFEMCPLRDEINPESVVEIGGIVSAGLENKRLIWIDGELTEHLFERERFFVPEDRKKNMPKIERSYKAIEIATGKEYFGKTTKELSNKINVSMRTLSNFIAKGSAKLNYEYIVEVTTNGETVRFEPPEKPKYKKYKYKMEKNGEVKTFYMLKKIAKVLNVNHKRVTKHIKSGELLKGFKITRRRLDGNNSKVQQ